MLYGTLGVIFPAIVFGIVLSILQNTIIYKKEITKADMLIYSSIIFYVVQSIRDFGPGYLYGYIFMIIYFYFNNKLSKIIIK